MLEQTADIFMGIRYLLKATGAQHVIIAIEGNKKDAARQLRGNTPEGLPVEVRVCPVKYPQGAEKMVIAALLGREIPSGGLPADVGAICVNVATTAEIGRLLPHGRGIQERVITIAGSAVERKGNYRIPIGTPVRFALEEAGVRNDVARVFMGGPMMGPSVSNLDIPVTKGTSGITAFSATDVDGSTGHKKIYPCIHCARCVEACPLFLNPSQLGILAKKEEYERMRDEFHLMDCFTYRWCSISGCPRK